jgi:hypothetical protein
MLSQKSHTVGSTLLAHATSFLDLAILSLSTASLLLFGTTITFGLIQRLCTCFDSLHKTFSVTVGLPWKHTTSKTVS